MLPNYSIATYESVENTKSKAYLTDKNKEHVQQKILGCLLFVLGLIAIPLVGLECIVICLMGLARIIY